MTDNLLSRYGLGRDPYAWRSDMDAQPAPPQNMLSQGPAPTGYDRIRDGIYNMLGGRPQNAWAADKLATAADVGTLGMLTGAYDGGQEMARTGQPGAMAMALMPGARPVGAVAKAATPAARRLISSQHYLDHYIVEAKRKSGDYTVRVSPPFEHDGEMVSVVLDGHHAMAAAKKDGKNPTVVEMNAREHDAIGLLGNGRTSEFLEATTMDGDWYDIVTGKYPWR